MSKPRFVSTAELAKELSISTQTVRALVRDHILKPMRVGRLLRFDLEECIKVLQERSR